MLEVRGLKFGIHGSGFDIYGLWFGFEGLISGGWGSGFQVEGLGFTVQGLRFGFWGLGWRVWSECFLENRCLTPPTIVWAVGPMNLTIIIFRG